jgi:hypothetical protein
MSDNFTYSDLYEGGSAPQQPEPEPEPGLDQFLAGIPAEEMPTDFVRIVSSAGGGAYDIPIDPEHTVNSLPGYTLRELLEMGNLAHNAATQFWSGEIQINLDQILANGAEVTAVGVLKGG